MLVRDLTNDRLSFRRLRRANDRCTRLDDACFFARYLCKRVSQERAMVERDGRDDRYFRSLDNVRRIEAATHANLHDHHIAARTHEMSERDAR